MTYKKTEQGHCSYCGAKPGEQCIVTLHPEVGPLSIDWQHAAREGVA